MPFDPFIGDTGLKDDYDGTIDSALFVQSDQGSWQLQLVIKADDGEEPVIKLGIGAKSGFTSYDGGESVQGPSTESRFNSSTGYFKFLNAAMRCGAAEELKTRSARLYDDHGPMHANSWVGLRFHFDVIYDLNANRPNDETGKWEKIKDEQGNVVGAPVITPTKYLGVAESLPANGQGSLMDNADLEKLTTAAQSSESYSQFAMMVMELIDADGNPMAKNKTVMSRLADQTWYEGLRSGVNANA